MRIGVVTEIKTAERRVALTPAGAGALVGAGHEVLVEAGAGTGAGFTDQEYALAGARILPAAADVWNRSELLVKVKEPLESEFTHLRADLTLFAYLHLAAAPALARALVDAGTFSIAYETVTDGRGRLPLLAPMSEIAGRLATQAGAYYLQSPLGGPGVLIGGAPGVAAARVVVIGGGVVGTNAARVAVGMGAEVTVLERSVERLRELDEFFDGRVRVVMSDLPTLEKELRDADLVIGAVLVPGAAAPKLITKEMVGRMRPHTVLVDVAIDQGGCAETSRPTTHEDPVYTVDEVVHYCVANMPGGVPVTATRALTNATLPWILKLAELGPVAAAEDLGLAAGVTTRDGVITDRRVAQALLSPPAPRAA
ncbi:MAG: alanine dehydrogenase [Frankia sp.]